MTATLARLGLPAYVLAAAFVAAAPASLPRLVSAPTPVLPPLAAGGGEVILEARVDADGNVAGLVTVRSTPPYTEALRDVVSGWFFEPARADEGPLEASVLVLGLFRPPAFYQGTTTGALPVNETEVPAELAAPERMQVPPYPPNAYGDGVAILELTIDPDGNVEAARTVSATPGFADAAARAVADWKFRPARVDGKPSPSTAVAVLGFREPVVPGG